MTRKYFLFTILLVFIAFAPALRNHFVYLDDDTHILENSSIRALDPAHIRQIFTTSVDKVYAPLTFLSFAVEYHFVKYNPFIYHLNNILLHLGVTALVFYFALQVGLSLRAGFAAALLFGIHPMHVESVAWVTERKDVLYAFFYMLSLSFYWKYLSRREIKPYVLTIVFGILSILSKPMALSLPLIFFVCDWLKRRSFDKWMILDKVPHFLYIVTIAWITYSLNARVPGENISSGIIIWIWTAVFYVHKFFFPLTLVPMYALPQPISWTNPHYLGSVGLFGILTIVLFIFRRQRWVVFAGLYYFFSMFFLFRYDNAVDKNIVADRFMYLPCLGICFLIGYSFDQLLKKEHLRKIVYVIAILITILLGVKTFAQTQLWKDSIPFWNHELTHYPDNATGYGNRGEAYKDIGRYDKALEDFNNAIRVDPKYAEGYNSRGQLSAMRGNINEALKDFLKVIELNPRFDEAYNNIGIIYTMKKDNEKALVYFKKAIEIDPANVEAHYNLGDFYYGQGDFEQAFGHFQKVIALNPNSAIGYNKRGLIYGIRQQYDLALSDFNRSIAIEPNNFEVYVNRGIVFEQKKLPKQALTNYNKAIQLNPDSADAYYGRGNVYATTGIFDQAAKDFEKALKINPHHLGAQRSQKLLNKLQSGQNAK